MSAAAQVAKLKGVRFNQVQQKATHNSYVRDETIFDELVYHRVRALEFDLHIDRSGHATTGRDWFVYHMFAAPYEDTQCVRLSDCLRAVKTFHDAFPQHEVVTLWLDLKDDFAPNGHEASDLDEAIGRVFGEDAVFRPRDLMRACPGAKNLREAVSDEHPLGKCAWPETKDLRGKVIFALTGGAACARGTKLDTYLGEGEADRMAFIAPDLDATCTFPEYARRPNVVFFNADAENAWRTEEVHRAGLVSRVYGGGTMGGGLDDPFQWNAARAHRTNFLATDRVNAEVDPWASTTQTKTGWPFLCLLMGCEPNQVEEGELVGVSVESGDIDGTSDSFYFVESEPASSASNATEATTWSSAIAVPSSNVERWAKGCIMARATRDADSPYFAVCRPADNGRIRVQYRVTKGGPTTELEAPRPAGLSAESTFFARLELSSTGGETTASSSASTDGTNWVPIATRSFATSLAHQGLAASSHGSSAVRFLFGNLKRGAESMGTKSFAAGERIGGALRGDVFRGAIP
ncbi:Ca2+-dependent phosphoinositide-specific phospholipase C [Pendulispora brunnea]|uniref:Ca2+-dependent phosphoinositide-specific phospholipase C n=1 Tax=Pendulispora brunnea TaxID=2905690 RepID=A0ABZ2KEZ8_9BACT